MNKAQDRQIGGGGDRRCRKKKASDLCWPTGTANPPPPPLPPIVLVFTGTCIDLPVTIGSIFGIVNRIF